MKAILLVRTLGIAQDFNLKDEFTVGHDSPGWKASRSIGIVWTAMDLGNLTYRNDDPCEV